MLMSVIEAIVKFDDANHSSKDDGQLRNDVNDNILVHQIKQDV